MLLLITTNTNVGADIINIWIDLPTPSVTTINTMASPVYEDLVHRANLLVLLLTLKSLSERNQTYFANTTKHISIYFQQTLVKVKVNRHAASSLNKEMTSFLMPKL